MTDDMTAEQIEAEIQRIMAGQPIPLLTDAEEEARIATEYAEQVRRFNATEAPSVTPPRYELTPAEAREVDRIAKEQGIK